jgi:HlyD family secretion protein
MKRKLIFIMGVAVLITIGGFLLMSGNSAPRYKYRFDRVSQGDLTETVITSGTLNAVVSVDVGTQVSGVISNLYADFNSEVKKGQIIARIDTTILWQAVKDARAALEAARVKAANSRRVLEREEALVEKQLDSQADYDSALTAEIASQQSLRQATSALDQAKINLAYATIRAPVDGVVINRAVNVGQTVAASYSSPVLYTIADDLSKMQVLATVDESDIGMISIGQKATFTVEAYPDRKFTGLVSQIRLNPVSIQNVVNYTVVIDVNNADLKLMPGMTADISVDVASAHNVMKVSNLALRFQPPPGLVDSAALRMISQRHSRSGGLRGNVLTAGTASADSSQLARGGAPIRVSLRQSPLFGHIVSPPAQDEDYGITPLYPEFQRPAYKPRHHAGRGRVWILEAQKKLRPVNVTTGVSDGRFTEVTSDSLKLGERIVLGAESESDASSGSNLFVSGRRGFGRRMY